MIGESDEGAAGEAESGFLVLGLVVVAVVLRRAGAVAAEAGTTRSVSEDLFLVISSLESCRDRVILFYFTARNRNIESNLSIS